MVVFKSVMTRNPLIKRRAMMEDINVKIVERSGAGC
jgi:hypothetical protein